MSREQRAALEQAQQRVRIVKEALALPATPGFVEERDALTKALAPLRTEAAALDERFVFLDQQAQAAEAKLESVALQAQARKARNEASPFAVIVASVVGVGVLWYSIVLAKGPSDPLTNIETLLAAAVPAFLLGALLRLRILPNPR
jgi:hypothetical protein